MRILSIQSSVAYGYAGNSAAAFPLRRLGHEVWAVDTVHFSNHTGYGSSRGIVFEPSVVADVIRGIAERGVLGSADVVLTGYQGSPGVAAVVLDAVAQVKAANPRAVYCCDPVMGDVGKGMYVRPGLPELIRSRVLPAADVLTPNAFELAYLAGTGGDPADAVPADVRTVDGVLRAADRVRAAGPRMVLVTSVEDGAAVRPVAGGCDGPGDTGTLFGLTDGEPGATASMIAVDDSGAYRVTTPRLPLLANGAGDVTAAVFIAHALTDGIEAALAQTASSVHELLGRTMRKARETGELELALVEAQDAIAHPGCEFDVVRLR